MKKFYFLFLIFCSQFSFGQFNLVKNPSFELYDTCVTGEGEISRAIYWTNPTGSSPDYLNACDIIGTHDVGVPSNFAGYEPARTGLGYAGIITSAHFHPSIFAFEDNYREYVQGELTDSLIQGVHYCIRFYVSAGDSMSYVCNNIGIYFSDTLVRNTCIDCNLPYTPQFENPSTNNLNSRTGWTLVSGSYTAVGSEKYIVIGNFRDTNTTITNLTGWTTNQGFYYSYYYIDDVLITPCDSLGVGVYDITQPTSELQLFPSVTENEINIESKNEQIKQIKIVSIVGETMYYSEEINKRQKIPINVSSFSSGIYIATIITNKNRYNLKFIKK